MGDIRVKTTEATDLTKEEGTLTSEEEETKSMTLMARSVLEARGSSDCGQEI